MIENRAIVPDLGERRGYHRSHIVTPYVRAMAHVGALGALKRFDRYRPQDPIVWRRAGRGIYWNTLKSDSLEHELLALARRRQRGLRQSIATMARWTGSTPDSVTRALKALVRRGVAMLEIGRGRYAVAVFRAIGELNPATINARDAGLDSDRYMARYTPEERAKLEADAYAWRSGLAMSLAEIGFHGPDAERDYLELVSALG